MVARLRAELAERVNITAENSKALVSLVADDVRRIVGLPTQLFLSLDGIEVWRALPVASRFSFSSVISEKDVPEVVRRLHESLLQDNPHCSVRALKARSTPVWSLKYTPETAATKKQLN